MSVRRAKNKMTGAPARTLEVVLGEFSRKWRFAGDPNDEGARQIRIHADYDTYICIRDPEQLAQLRRDLDTAARYMDGKPVILEGEDL
jgi:hypothetical protein